MTLVKTLNGHTSQEVTGGGTKSFVSFDRLMYAIKNEVNLKPNEEIIGFTVDENGLLVSIKTKS